MRRQRPSHTAVKIGKGMVFLAQDPKMASLLPEGTVDYSERLMTRVGLLRSWELSLYRSSGFRKFAAFVERRTMSGGVLHVVLRKRFMDDETRAAIGEGARQVLVVGAGFDTLSARLAARFPEVTFVEVDRPGTHKVKREGIESLGDLRPNLHLLGADLASTRLEDVLSSINDWQRGAVSVVLAEGVFMYLEESAVSTFLSAVHSLTGVGSRLLFTYMRADEKGRIYAGRLSFLTRISLELIGEPWRWGVREGSLRDFLSKHGFTLDASPGRCDLRRRYLEPAGLAELPLGDVEHVAIAER